MSKIPCKKCKSCGVYHDLSVITCNECGANLQKTPPVLIETEDIPVEQYGEIDDAVTVFVQKCSACGALNFTADKDSPVKICYNCHKTRVACIKPVEFRESLDTISANDDSIQDNDVITEKNDASTDESAENEITIFDDDENDDESIQWQGILGNIRKSVGGVDSKPVIKTETESQINNQHPDHSNAEEDDDDDVSDWSGILGGKPAPKKAVATSQSPSITLTAIRYGRLSFTLEAKQNEEYMLGRSAYQREFLCNDGRVGNEHCYLFFKNGFWYVKDNHSSNGTAVNSRDLGLNGESKLNDGDELKLGHHPDSMAFRITIK